MIVTPAKAAFACLGLLCAAACAPHRPPAVMTSRIVDSIKADEVDWNADYRSGDPARVATHYAPNATVVTPGAAPLVGAPAIRAALNQAYQDSRFGVVFASDRVDVARSGDLAASKGWWRETTTDPKTGQAKTSSGYFVTVYKPQPDGKWRAVWDILTPGPPGATDAPPNPGIAGGRRLSENQSRPSGG
jgi:uncharacterized protein (TIGR02246 family)